MKDHLKQFARCCPSFRFLENILGKPAEIKDDSIIAPHRPINVPNSSFLVKLLVELNKGSESIARFALFVLGVPRLEQDGVPVSVQRRKVFALLIYLAVTGRSHTRDTLAALFWPNENQRLARAALRRALSDLKKIMGDKVVTTDAGALVLIENLDFWLDVREFHRQLDNVRTHPHLSGSPCTACLNHLAEAIRLYRADFLTGFSLKDSASFDEWMCQETESSRRELTGALKQLTGLHKEGAVKPNRRSPTPGAGWSSNPPMKRPTGS